MHGYEMTFNISTQKILPVISSYLHLILFKKWLIHKRVTPTPNLTLVHPVLTVQTTRTWALLPTGNINKTPGLGLTQGGADYDAKYATYLKLFSGEMIKAYEAACIAKGTVQSRTLRNGKSLQFIYTGRMTADYHQPGTPILGSGDPPVAEKTIIMDDLLVASAFPYMTLDETLGALLTSLVRSLPRLVTPWLKHTTRKSSV